jgi:hypothetical protein
MESSRGSPPRGVPVGLPGVDVGVTVGVTVGVGVGVAVGDVDGGGRGGRARVPGAGAAGRDRDVAGAEAVVGAVVVVPDAAAVVEHDLQPGGGAEVDGARQPARAGRLHRHARHGRPAAAVRCIVDVDRGPAGRALVVDGHAARGGRGGDEAERRDGQGRRQGQAETSSDAHLHRGLLRVRGSPAAGAPRGHDRTCSWNVLRIAALQRRLLRRPFMQGLASCFRKLPSREGDVKRSSHISMKPPSGRLKPTWEEAA